MSWDAIVIGSGFGGAMAAYALVNAGQRVLMLERGSWVARSPENWSDRNVGLRTPHFSMESPYEIRSGATRRRAGSWNCVGGQSVFYGGASYRLRESDFSSTAEVVGDSGAEWPFDYHDLEPYYLLAERLLGVNAGSQELSAPAKRVAEAALRLKLNPTRIPVAIAQEPGNERRACMRCGTCDGYACAAEAKNDLATGIIPSLIRRGMTLRANTVCVRLVREQSRITGVEYVDRVTGERGSVSAANIVLAAGTLATPHLILASRLDRVNPAADAVGRYLTRHYNVGVFGVFGREPNPSRSFDKQIALLDFYEDGGSIQQMTPPLALVRAYLPRGTRNLGAWLVEHSLGLVTIAEDEPQQANGVTVDRSTRDRYGLPKLIVDHRHSPRDESKSAFLVRNAKRVLREAGARLCWTHRIETFTHALGTVRLGVDPGRSPLDGDGRYRGLDNLYVTDGSALPRSAGVNPSLTIAANALRIGARLAASSVPRRRRILSVLSSRPMTTTAGGA